MAGTRHLGRRVTSSEFCDEQDTGQARVSYAFQSPEAVCIMAGSSRCVIIRDSDTRLIATDLLAGTKAVYIGDSAAFPRLPAKNLTFTIMANALRIGRLLRAELTR